MKIQVALLLCLTLGFNAGYAAPESSALFPVSQAAQAKEADAKVYSKNPEANALYVQGLEFLSKGDPRKGGTLENAHKAQELFRQAVEKDPNFALAYIGQSDALEVGSFSVSGAVIPSTIYRQQEAFALKAAQLDDSLTEAHLLLAEIYYDNAYDWPKAEKELKRAIELSPNLVPAHTRYALFLGTMGRFEEAEAQVKLAAAINPNSATPNRALLRIRYWQHKDAEALEQGREALKKDKGDIPTHFFMGLVYLQQGEFEKGIEEEKIAVTLGDAGSLAALAYAYAVAGNKPGVTETLERFNNHPSHNIVNYRLAAVYVALGDKNRALDLIEKDYEQRNSWVNWLKIDPVMDPLRQEPRFKKLMEKMNFKS